MEKISIALATYNEEQNIENCLKAVYDWADEIVIVDGGSTDHTLDIAKKYKAKIIRTDNPVMFHINKQKALNAAAGPWILQLDADETVTESLWNEIKLCSDEKYTGYYIPRNNYFWGHRMKKGGQYPDYVIRLIKKGKAMFPCKSVHEQIKVEGSIGYLKNALEHISYRTSKDYWRKADNYTTLTALELKRKGVKNSIPVWIQYNLLKPLQTFIRLFIRHKGFMDGWYGFVFAYWSALHFPIAYKKFLKL